MRFESTLSLRSVSGATTGSGEVAFVGMRCGVLGFSGDMRCGVRAFSGDTRILFRVAVGDCKSCGTFSLSSNRSIIGGKAALFGVATSIGTDISSTMSLKGSAFHCLLAVLLCVSTSVTNGELGGPSQSMKLAST